MDNVSLKCTMKTAYALILCTILIQLLILALVTISRICISVLNWILIKIDVLNVTLDILFNPTFASIS